MSSASAAAAETGPVYFWGRENAYEFMSQFHSMRFRAPLPTRASIAGTGAPGPEATFLFAEQYMMYSKAALFDDAAAARDVLAATTPKDCKAVGRRVRGFNERTWDAHKEAVVEQGNWCKFTAGEGRRGADARARLLATGDRQLVEASPYDRIWGIGFAAKDADANRARWGENLLGEAMMKVRARIREQGA